MLTPTSKKLLITLILISVLGFGAYMFSQSSSSDSQEVVTTTPLGEDILAVVQKFQNVTIDKTFFSSPLLTNLRDISVPLYNEPQGRPNPFSPIGIDFGTVDTSQYITGGTQSGLPKSQ